MNSRHPGRPKQEGPWPPCKASGCSATTEGGSKGFCHTHYIAARRGRLDWDTGAELRPLLRVRSYKQLVPGSFTPCLLPGCPAPARSKGMCSSHAQKRRIGLIDALGNKLRDAIVFRRQRKKTRWIGREGYVLVQAPADHPHARQDGTILEHRLVMERVLGRFLQEWEIVHHKNGNRSDNSWENLELLDGRAKNGSEAHPPGHELDVDTAIQVLLQQDTIPFPLRQLLLEYLSDRRRLAQTGR